MKKINILFAGALIAWLITGMTGCSSNATSEEAKTDTTEQVAPVEPAAPAEPELEKEFTTAKGTFNIEKVAQQMYDDGLRRGTSAKTVHTKVPSIKKPKAKEIESDFKGSWIALYGVPNNDLAKEVYKQALDVYKKGFEDGWNF